MKKESKFWVLLLVSSILFASCGLIPNKFIYPLDEPDKKTEKSSTMESDHTVNNTVDTKPAMAKPQSNENQVDSMVDAAKLRKLPEGALVRTFNLAYDKAWEKVIEIMLTKPLISTDRSGGIIITDWIVDPKGKIEKEGGMFSSAVSIDRERYLVKIYDLGDKVDVAIIQLAQRSGTRHWIDRPALTGLSVGLMREITLNLEN